MYFYALAALIMAAAFRRKGERRTASRAPYLRLDDLDDHHLRDIGLVRERPARTRNHLMWM
jgi:uncharacterized protein YjiS (DUF1127 family)